MYRHILVPVDDSDLSIDTASKAVELAKNLGARITFVHARRDFGATGSGALVHAMSPTEFADQAAGNARAVLAKAESEARYVGVECELVAKTSDRPYEVIIDTAEERGCDLIFMASHGQRGLKKLFLGSQTKKVLAHTPIPVLVSTVESNARSPEMSAAISIVKGEHRSMGAVLGGLKHVLANARENDAMADIDLVRAIIYYLREFPAALHHPKEEAFLFARLRERFPASEHLLSQIAGQHHEQDGMIDAIEAALSAYEGCPDRRNLESLTLAAERFSEALWTHMDIEEKSILTACREHLTEDDWKQISQAFSENGDPRFDADLEAGYEKFLARLMNLAPQSARSVGK